MATVDVTPEWLTRVLRDGGYLDAGEVCSVSVDAKVSSNANTAYLKLSYSRDALGNTPSKLFLKLHSIKNGLFGNSEVLYYTTIAAEIEDPPIPHCYHAAYSKDTGHYHLLLEDLSDTHVHNWNVAPEWDRVAKTVEAMAQLHAGWWSHPNLSGVGKVPNQEAIEKYVTYPEEGLAPMLDDIGEHLPQEWRELIDNIFGQHRHRMAERATDGKDLTCIHGDPNPGNILSPRDSGGRAYLIDRQLFDRNLPIWLGVSDVAYMMVHWWDTDVRRRLERPVLEYYHQGLKSHGIQNYLFSQLWDDYRLCAMQSLYVATAWCVDPIERREYKWVWLPQLKKTMAACIDLNCVGILR